MACSTVCDEPMSKGYDECFDPPLEIEYVCPICVLGLREPLQTSCGHRFCKDCIERSIRDNGYKCPINNEQFSEQLYPDFFAIREMMARVVFCGMKQHGCPWKGFLKYLQVHLNECPLVDKDLQQRSLTRKQMASHVSTQIEAQVSGPSYVRPQSVTETLPQEQTTQEEQISQLSVRTEHQQNEIDGMRRIITELTNTARHLGCQVEPSRVRQASSLEELTLSCNRFETRLLECEGRACNGSYIWQIENYRQCQQDAIRGVMTSQYSPPFYTNLYGYKFCMRICLNSVDNGVGKHVALFIHMMRGDYDDILEWPFTGRITLSIMDQSDRQHISETLLARPYLPSFQKPTGPLNQQGYGFVEFAPIELIREPRYVKDNILLVKCDIV